MTTFEIECTARPFEDVTTEDDSSAVIRRHSRETGHVLPVARVDSGDRRAAD